MAGSAEEGLVQTRFPIYILHTATHDQNGRKTSLNYIIYISISLVCVRMREILSETLGLEGEDIT